MYRFVLTLGRQTTAYQGGTRVGISPNVVPSEYCCTLEVGLQTV